MAKKIVVRIILIVFTLLILTGSVVHGEQILIDNSVFAQDIDALGLDAPSAILTEADRGQVLYQKDPHAKLHISSVCKLMTVLIAAESGAVNSNVTISQDSVDADGSALNLEVGQKYTLEDLLYGIMLTSANDAAKAVAEYMAGDPDSFVVKMNDMATKLNMADTHFTNPTGLYDKNQYTSAYDISILLKYALKNQIFNKIFSTEARPWENKDGTDKILTSQNKLFWSYDGVDGGKTGYNFKEQQTVVTTVTRNNMRLICIVLDSPEKDLFTNASTMLDYGFNKFRKSILVHKNDVLKTITVENTNVDLISIEDVYYVHPTGDNYIKEFSTTSDPQLPLKKNVIAGSARYILNDDSAIDISLYPTVEVTSSEDFLSSARKKLSDNKDIFYLLVFLVLVEVILLIFYIFKFFKKLVRKKQNKK